MAELAITAGGLRFPNPFVLGSGPPGTSGEVIERSFELGWGGIVCKTLSLESDKVVNTVPRYAKLLGSGGKRDVIGFQNIELISDRPFATWLPELARCKRRFPERILIASIMEEHDRARWHEITERTQATGVDALELNLSCPHGLPERRMGSAMGQDPEIVAEVVGWVKEVAAVPVWAKLTPNITDITLPARAAVAAGADGISAINTILCTIGIDLETFRPLPTVEGHSEPGGYSGRAVRPIALRQVMECARACPGVPISGMGGIETAADAAQFLLVGASTVQICTGAMLHGYGIIDGLCSGLAALLDARGLARVADLVGRSLPYFTTHADLVARQRAAGRGPAAHPGPAGHRGGGSDLARETDALAGE